MAADVRRTALSVIACLVVTGATVSAPGFASAGVVPVPHPAAALRASAVPLPARLSHVGAATQVIVVTTSSWSTSYATLTAWQKTGRTWALRWGPVAARVGANGLAPAPTRRQDTYTTPAGTFGLGPDFGSAPNPGVPAGVTYRRTTGRDWWAYDKDCPSTYNRWVKGYSTCWSAGMAEHLVTYAEYKYAAVIAYNLPTPARPTPRLSGGGGIFLHLNGRGATAGCVSSKEWVVVGLLRWLRPGARIVIGPSASITSM
jgi:L,D-peptidoglycan transpeptidase YkuD (ErfK/YbiS/YcfS/YnhG family)